MPPLVGETIGKAIKKYFQDGVNLNGMNLVKTGEDIVDMPKSTIEAADRLWNLVEQVNNKNALKELFPQ